MCSVPSAVLIAMVLAALSIFVIVPWVAVTGSTAKASEASDTTRTAIPIIFIGDFLLREVGSKNTRLQPLDSSSCFTPYYRSGLAGSVPGSALAALYVEAH